MTLITSLKYAKPVLKRDQPDDTYKFQPLPEPTGNYPYHLSLKDIIPDVNDQQMVFHLVGDTGSIGSDAFQRQVALEMAGQYGHAVSGSRRPQFLYHLGDIVYNHGEASQYYGQFFEPFQKYPGPVFAIPGNHDADVNPASEVPYQSLDAFTTVFCDTEPRPVIFRGAADWKSIVQPNVYWTLDSPLAIIIGLHSNVPKYGVITPEQRSWFIGELKAAELERPDKALIICLHHAPYSADINHGSSLPMIEFLEDAFNETGIRPDIVFSGHVHNYQCFNKFYGDGITVPYIVAGAGGYDGLHVLANRDDELFSSIHPEFDDVQLAGYCDDRHGFLKVSIVKSRDGLTLTGEYYTVSQEGPSDPDLTLTLADRFIVTIS